MLYDKGKTVTITAERHDNDITVNSVKSSTEPRSVSKGLKQDSLIKGVDQTVAAKSLLKIV